MNNDNSIQSLFEKAGLEIAQDEERRPVEISLSTLNPAKSKEEIDVLFSIADESLRDSGSKKLYVEEIATSDTRTVLADSLRSELAKVEKLSATPVYSLKNAPVNPNKAQEHETDLPGKKPRLPVPSPVLPRALAFAIDMFVVVLLAFGPAAVLHYSLFGTDGLGLLGIWDNLEFVTFSTLFIILLAVSYFVYPLLTLALRVRPVGLALMDLRIRRVDGDRIRFSNAFVRILTVPLSAITFGYIPIFFGKSPLHDVLARTVVCEA